MQIQHEWVEDKVMKARQAGSKEPKVNMNTNDLFRRITGVTMTQLSKEDKYAQVSVGEGIKRHGDKAVAAVLAEFGQLNDNQVFKPCDPSQLPKSAKREALNLITMIK